MKDLNTNTKAHLFVCCRQRDDKACCQAIGAEKLVTELQKWLKETELKGQIKVSRSSCLGHCESGITACLYPQNKWLHEVSLEDLPKIKNMLEVYAD